MLLVERARRSHVKVIADGRRRGRDRSASSSLDAKFWGVVLMGASVMIFSRCPGSTTPGQVDPLPARWHKYVYAVFVIAFVVLGYLGMQAPTPVGQRSRRSARCSTSAFFLLMPWWSAMGQFKPVPERVTFDAH